MADLQSVNLSKNIVLNEMKELDATFRSLSENELQDQQLITILDEKIQAIESLNQEIKTSANEYLNEEQPVETYHVKALEISYQSTFKLLTIIQKIELAYTTSKSPSIIQILRLNGFKLAKSIYENFYSHKILRRVFKDLMTEEPSAKSFSIYMREYLSLKNKTNLKKFVDENPASITQYLNNIPTEEELTFNYDLINFSDFIYDSSSAITYTLSKGFGSIAGSVKFRKGYLYKNKTVEKSLLKVLKPLDMILFKYNFALTDKAIPGYFGHVAIYFGNEAQLNSLGIWNHPLVRPYQEEIRAGKVILEALRPGIQLRSMEEILNTDEFAIVRKKEFEKDEAQETALRGLTRVGSKYDFNFDVNTKTIVCSELPRFSFEKIRFPTSESLGRYTISPDNVAELIFYKNSPLKFISNTVGQEGNKFEVLTSIDSNLDRLGFVKSKGIYKAKVETCEYKMEKRFSNSNGKGGSMKNVRVKHCQTTLEEKIYKSL